MGKPAICLLLFSTLLLSLVASKVLPIDEEDQLLYERFARQGVEKFNQQSNDVYKWELDRTWEVERKLSGGIHYSIFVTLVKTDCKKGQETGETGEKCRKTDTLKKCQVEISRRVKRHGYGLKDIAHIKNCEEEFTRNIAKFDHRKIKLTHDDSVTVQELRKAKIIKPRDYVIWNSFLDFIDRHEKRYENKREVLKRFRVFKRNAKVIRELQKNEQGTAVYGFTKFSDMTTMEFKETMLPYQWEQPVPMDQANFEKEGVTISEEDLPDSFDWREHGAVTQVKNQGSCGSCWAFSTTGNIEGAWFLAKKKLVSLSEQELVDCDSVDQGCNGGLPSNAYKEIIRMGGLEPEDAYPYDGRGETCHLVRKDIAVYINGSVELPHDEVEMQKWLVTKGPISIGLNANTLQFYRHGVVHPFKIFCEPFMLNHGVLIVGYGKDGRKPYWIVKNSWGPTWGEAGYFKLYRGKNVCGVQEMATSSLVN